jgi:8-oxo-dGTP diphosphatase
VDSRKRVLLFLRDDKPDIPFPNMWDVPGGHLEPGETPEQCIVREMKEEIDLDLRDFHLFRVTEFGDRIEVTFWKRLNLDIENTRLTEGQALRWFTRKEAAQTDLALGFNEIVEAFFREAPFR